MRLDGERVSRIQAGLRPSVVGLWESSRKARAVLDAVLGTTHSPASGTLRARYRAKSDTPGLLAKIAIVTIASREFSESWCPVSREVRRDSGSLLVVVAAKGKTNERG